MKKTKHGVIDVINLSSGTFILRLDRKDFEFTAGQYVILRVPDQKDGREYSISSGVTPTACNAGAVLVVEKNEEKVLEVNSHRSCGSTLRRDLLCPTTPGLVKAEAAAPRVINDNKIMTGMVVKR